MTRPIRLSEKEAKLLAENLLKAGKELDPELKEILEDPENPAQSTNEKEKESLIDRIWNWLPPYAKTSESLTGFLFYVLFGKKPVESRCKGKVKIRERTRTKPLPGPAIVAMDQSQDGGAT